MATAFATATSFWKVAVSHLPRSRASGAYQLLADVDVSCRVRREPALVFELVLGDVEFVGEVIDGGFFRRGGDLVGKLARNQGVFAVVEDL